MAALDFPDTPSIGTVYDRWTWNGTLWALTAGAAGGGADTRGFTFAQDTQPTPTRVGDTWFDTSTLASGGTSWVAVEEGAAGSEKVWVQFAPSQAAPAPPAPIYPIGRWRRTAFLALTANTVVNVPWDTALADPRGMIPTLPGSTINIPEKGIWAITATWAYGAGASRQFLALGVTSANYPGATAGYRYVAGVDDANSLDVTLQLNAGDSFGVSVFSSSNQASTQGGLSVSKVGDY